MKKIFCPICKKELGWYDTKERIISFYDKNEKAKYIGNGILITTNCCNETFKIKLD